MLQAIKYRVQFPTTGRLIEANFDLDTGVTCISGANESGKSMVIEMIRYCLFGKAALRGLASDYKGLDARLKFSVSGVDYSVVRNARGETLSSGNTVMASGASTLNEAIPRLLGFNLTVFDVACACNQGDIERLTNMTAAERKKMIDSVVGMNQLDGVERWCRDEANRLKREAEAVLEGQRRPAVPERPEDYAEASVLQPLLVDAEARYHEATVLSGVQEPAMPLLVEGDLGEIEASEATRVVVLERLKSLQAQLARLPEATHTAENLDAFEAYRVYSTEVQRRGPRPDYPASQVHDMLGVWDQLDAFDKSVECPDCGSVFVPGAEKLGDRPAEPVLTRSQCLAQLRACDRWEEPLVEVPASSLVLTEAELRAARAALGRAEERAAIIAALADTVVSEDRSAELRALRQYIAEIAAYEPAKDAYDTAQARLAELGDVSIVTSLRRRHTEARVYEAQLKAFLEAEQGYDRDLDRAAKRQADAEAMRRAAEALRSARTKVKQHLVPALSSVASRYLSSMTAGARSVIEIDDDFEILVDGQRVATLPGSAKAVANLAVRLGLGQVLTQRMFPVFLGDEIDAAMDSDRSDTTADTLRGLSDRISQVILVSHKKIEADHRIEL